MVQFVRKLSIEAQRTFWYVSIEAQICGQNVPFRIVPRGCN